MALSFPYTYFQCPCVSDLPIIRKPTDLDDPIDDDEENERTFDPRAPRSNFSLYPLEYLHYCQDCHQLRCPRCSLDEIATWYCPNCLFEVPGSTVKSEGNRCTRSCFQCPICIAPLSVVGLDNPNASKYLDVESAPGGPWVLNCSCCQWSSKEVGLQFDRPNGIYSQLMKSKNGVEKAPVEKSQSRERYENITIEEINPLVDDGGEKTFPLDAGAQFVKLKSFYSTQLAESSSNDKFALGDLGYGSPRSLTRLMNLYTGGSFGGRKAKSKDAAIREANGPEEGLQSHMPDATSIERLAEGGWESTTTKLQRSLQVNNTRFVSDLQPIPYLLRTKRSTRCRVCKHILSKPDPKVQSTRFRIRLVAPNYVPTISIKPLPTPSFGSSTSTPPTTPAAVPSYILKPLKPVQYLLTLKNPLYDPVKITLATPSHTPGRFASKITILCPQFEIGASTDVWDEVLNTSNSSGDRRSTRDLGSSSSGLDSSQIAQAEAGKVWERGRNWVSVVVEVVPASLRPELSLMPTTELGRKENTIDEEPEASEDEEILEIPVFVHVEWETDAAADDALGKDKDKSGKEGKEKRELAYWCVLGVGKIAREW